MSSSAVTVCCLLGPFLLLVSFCLSLLCLDVLWVRTCARARTWVRDSARTRRWVGVRGERGSVCVTGWKQGREAGYVCTHMSVYRLSMKTSWYEKERGRKFSWQDGLGSWERECPSSSSLRDCFKDTYWIISMNQRSELRSLRDGPFSWERFETLHGDMTVKICILESLSVLRHFSGRNDVIHRQHVIMKMCRYVRIYTWECIPVSSYRRWHTRKSKRIFVVRMIRISFLTWSRRDETSLRTSSLLFQDDYWNHLLNSWKLSFADCRLMFDPLLFSLNGANCVDEIWSWTSSLRLFSRTDHTWK